MTRREKVKAIHREQRQRKRRRKQWNYHDPSRSHFDLSLGMDHNSMMAMLLPFLMKGKMKV